MVWLLCRPVLSAAMRYLPSLECPPSLVPEEKAENKKRLHPVVRWRRKLGRLDYVLISYPSASLCGRYFFAACRVFSLFGRCFELVFQIGG